MHEYDVALKSLVTGGSSELLTQLTGRSSLTWLNVEQPKVNNRRVDLMGEDRDRELVQIEFQSRNQRTLAIRMGAYLFDIGAVYGRLPVQIVVYVGEPRMRMSNRVANHGLSYRFHLVDIRDLDGERLLASENMGDNVIATLTRLGREPETVRRILKKIAAALPEQRERAMADLMLIAGLRKLGREVRREATRMPILNDIMEHEVLGPAIRQGRMEGLAEGRVEGRMEGRVEGQLEVLLGQMEKRFGRVPPAIRKRLTSLKPDQLKAAALRLLDARRVEDMFAK